MMTNELRKKLDFLTTPPIRLNEQSDDSAWDAWLVNQITNIANLAMTYPHNIRIFERSNVSTQKLNCFALAFGITAETIGAGPSPTTMFTAQLLESGCLEERSLTENKASDDDILIYCHSGFPANPTHAGRLSGGRVISKWGNGRTHTWEHPLFEVPETYGNSISLLSPVS
jgi:hypothetical protein